MKVILKVNFDSISNAEFYIENPPVIPVEGDSVSFEWKDFISDKKEIKKLENYDKNHIWMVNVLFKRYSKKQALVQIVLMEEGEYSRWKTER